ncbi:MAG: pyridoxal-dependent decarboxylase, exosortase A system-associated, partial [Sphingomonadales bacterium]
DGELVVGGHPVTDLVREYGTPLFLYEKAFLDKRVGELRAALPERISIHYAIKANPLPELVRHMGGLVDGLDVASAGELDIALKTGKPARDISFAGPGKTDDELQAALRAGCLVVLESLNEARRLAALAQEKGLRPPVALRINPNFELKTAGMRMSGGAKPFGVDAEIAADVLKSIGDLPLDFQGLHVFTGSQNLKLEALIEAYHNIFELTQKLKPYLPGPLRWLNIGGGLGVPYFPGDTHLDVVALGDALREIVESLGDDFKDAEVIMELGRYLVAEAGVYLCKVVDKKVSRGETFLITDGGLHHQLAVSGNFGQVLRKNYPVAVANRLNGAKSETVNIVGCLCTPLDRLGDQMDLPESEVGDLIAIFLAGAYGASASPQAFLGHLPVREILV